MVFKRAIMKDINQVMVEIIRSNDLADFPGMLEKEL
jgi:hypothetical protein